ncbi:MAG: hypothetical protein ACFHVJ_09765 [Aestuariibacter sp.]
MNNTLQGEQPSVTTAESQDHLDHDFDTKDNRAVARLKRGIKRIKSGFRDKFSKLTFSQWMYLLAFFTLFFTAETDSESMDSFLTAGIIAGVGLIRELWYLFMRIWAHTAGKGLLFVLYAATANFALAVSALKINSISGVEPTVFIFTMGFTTLLMLPFWLILASMVFLGTALVVGNFWLLIALLLRLVGIRLPTHWEDQSFAVLTLILRIILIPALLWALAALINPYIKQMDMFNDTMGFEVIDTRQLSSEQVETNAQSPEAESGATQLDANTDAQTELRTDGVENITTAKEQDFTKDLTAEQKEALKVLQGLSFTKNGAEVKIVDSTSDEDEEKAAGLKWLDLMVAQFIYRFETYPYSACAKEPRQRVLTINENLVFVAERDKNYETGIKFSAMECVPRNTVHEKGLKTALPSDNSQPDSVPPDQE